MPRFAKVLALPDPLHPETVYLLQRPDAADEFDLVVPDADGDPVYARLPNAQMVVESAPGALLPADTVFGRYYATEDLELREVLSGAIADVAATNESVIPVLVDNVVVARARFAAGQDEAVIEILDADIAAPALLVFKTPAVQDPTLSGVVGTFGARRR